MKATWRMLAAVGVALVLAGCGGSDDDDGGSAANNADVTGNWTGTWVNTATGDTGVWTMVLAQTGDTVTGTDQVDGTNDGVVSGLVEGNVFSYSITEGADLVETGELTVDGDTMSGTWADPLTGSAGTTILTRD